MISLLPVATRSARAFRAADGLDARRSGQMISIRISRMTGNVTQLVVDATEVLLERQAQARAHHRFLVHSGARCLLHCVHQ
jgi:hypothetical protein